MNGDKYDSSYQDHYQRVPLDPEDIFCFYCHKQYKTVGGFKRHVIDKHGLGMGAILELLTNEEEAERQQILAENDQTYHSLYARRRKGGFGK